MIILPLFFLQFITIEILSQVYCRQTGFNAQELLPRHLQKHRDLLVGLFLIADGEAMPDVWEFTASASLPERKAHFLHAG